MDIVFLEQLEKSGRINDPLDFTVMILLLLVYLLFCTGFMMVLIGSAGIARNKLKKNVLQ